MCCNVEACSPGWFGNQPVYQMSITARSAPFVRCVCIHTDNWYNICIALGNYGTEELIANKIT